VGIIVGLCTVELFIPESQSLKDKRQVLLSLKDRLREKFNLSVAEVDGQDLWQKEYWGLPAWPTKDDTSTKCVTRR
jgi:uncharacterized protein YlxP (DUF503 family)